MYTFLVVRTPLWINPCSCISFCYSSPSESGWNGSSTRSWYDCGRFVAFFILFIKSSSSYSRRYSSHPRIHILFYFVASIVDTTPCYQTHPHSTLPPFPSYFPVASSTYLRTTAIFDWHGRTACTPRRFWQQNKEKEPWWTKELMAQNQISL